MCDHCFLNQIANLRIKFEISKFIKENLILLPPRVMIPISPYYEYGAFPVKLGGDIGPMEGVEPSFAAPITDKELEAPLGYMGICTS